MPVSFLMGLGTPIAEFSWVKPALATSRIVYIGLRDVDAGEKRILRENNIKAFSMHDVDKHGIGKVVEMALDYVNPDRTRPIHLSFDVDALDPSVAPSTGTPVSPLSGFRDLNGSNSRRSEEGSRSGRATTFAKLSTKRDFWSRLI